MSQYEAQTSPIIRHHYVSNHANNNFFEIHPVTFDILVIVWMCISRFFPDGQDKTHRGWHDDAGWNHELLVFFLRPKCEPNNSNTSVRISASHNPAVWSPLRVSTWQVGYCGTSRIALLSRWTRYWFSIHSPCFSSRPVMSPCLGKQSEKALTIFYSVPPAADFDGIQFSVGARGSLVGWGTMLQAGRSWIRFPMRSLDFFQLT
jgi:hypothetical protein